MAESTARNERPIATLRSNHFSNPFDLNETAKADAEMLAEIKTMFPVRATTIRASYMIPNEQGLNMEMSVKKLFPDQHKIENTHSVPACEYVTVYSQFEQAKLEFITLKNTGDKQQRTIALISSFTDADKQRFKDMAALTPQS